MAGALKEPVGNARKDIGAKSIHVYEDNFNTDENYLKEVCNEMDKRGFYSEWSGRGEAKMSSSGEGVIFLTDSPEEVRRKINKHAFSGGQPTLELQRKKGGNPDIDVSFQYLKMFFEPDDKKLEKIEKDYRTGKLLTGELCKLPGVSDNSCYLAEIFYKISCDMQLSPQKCRKGRGDLHGLKLSGHDARNREACLVNHHTGLREVREIKPLIHYLASYRLGEFRQNPLFDWLHVDQTGEEKKESSCEQKEDEETSYYPEDNFLMFSHPRLFLRKECRYPSRGLSLLVSRRSL
jgi:hypothetical protein